MFLFVSKNPFFIETVKMEWSPVGHWSQWPEVTSPRQLLPEDEKNWRANCFCSNRLDTGRQEAVDFAQQPTPPLVPSKRHYLWNYQQARGEIP